MAAFANGIIETPTKPQLNFSGGVTNAEAETKQTPFRRRYFQMHFLERESLNSD